MRAITITKHCRPKTIVAQMAIALGIAHSLYAGFVGAQAAPATPPDATTKPATDAQTAPKAAEAPRTIEEIVVTAQRRPENKQNVSVSVSAITAETLNERNITDLSKMEGMAPGFTFGRSGTDARPAMRGVSLRTSRSMATPPLVSLLMVFTNRARSRHWPALWICRALKFSVARKAPCMAAILSAAISRL